MEKVSIIIPIFNGGKWIDQCFNAINQHGNIKACNSCPEIEVVVTNDGSNDETPALLEKWNVTFKQNDISYVVIHLSSSKGVGAAKNIAVAQSTGTYLCFQDIDDIMLPDRIYQQWKVASQNKNALVGSQIIRTPTNSTPRFVKWANNLSPIELRTQIYTSNGPTLLMPTWFCHRTVYDKVGGFDETGYGTPEDLIFFYEHLDNGGDLIRVDEILVSYTYHKDATTFSIGRKVIWNIQLDRLQRNVLKLWKSFTIWNAGKRGRKFVRSLAPDNLKKIVAFCDVDPNKIGHTIELYDAEDRLVIAKIPVIHFTQAEPPLVICVKLDLTNGEFERNLKSLNLTEGEDYVLFC